MKPKTRAELALQATQTQEETPQDDVDDADADPEIPEIPPSNHDNDIPANVEGRRFAKILAKALSEAIAQALTTRATTGPDPTKYPKAKDPGMFNGRKRRYLRTWIGENEICFRTAPHLYRAETSKVMFAGSFLEGDAKTWFTDYFHDPANIPAFMSNWTLFVAELQANFGLEDELGAAEEDMRRLTMTDKDHASYFTARFRAIVANLGGAWGDRNLRNQYYQKLAPRLHAQFVSAGSPVPGKLDALATKVDRFDRAYWADYKMNKILHSYASPSEKRSQPAQTTPKTTPRAPSPATLSGSTQRPVTAKPFPSPHLTKDGKLTAEEKQRRMDAGACFYCGEMGHMTAACPKKGQPRARAATDNSAGVTTTSTVSSATPATRQTARASLVVLDESNDSGND